MSNIPINPSMINQAQNYTTPQSSIALSICNVPKEGAAFCPMQFKFNTTPSWFVDMTLGGPAGPVLSQVACLFVDNSASTHDVNILFPDSGYQVRIGQGDGQLVPVLTTGGQPPKFYVLLDSSGATSATDVCNVFAINQFIPEFVTANTASFQNVLSYGYGALFVPTPTFTQSSYFETDFSGPAQPIIINANQWYITGININGVVQSTGASGSYTIVMTDLGSGRIVFGGSDIITSTLSRSNLVSMSNLNIQSAGGGSCQIRLLSGVPWNTSNSDLTVNLYGGILVP